jgi:molybdopterin synthase catalytic subunit
MKIEVTIHDGPLDTALRSKIAGAGALLAFEGVVRAVEDGRPISGLRYQTYDPMAERQLERLAQEAIAEFDLLAVAVEHSRGFVPTGRCSFRLQIASSHRKQALAAMDWYIDRLKRDVPIWKSPVFVNEPEAARP